MTLIESMIKFFMRNKSGKHGGECHQYIKSKKIEGSVITNKLILNDPLNQQIIKLPTIQEILRKEEAHHGRFFRNEPLWVDFEEGYIIERKEVMQIIKMIDHKNICTIFGKPASGKSVILKYIGYKLAADNAVYYIDFKKYDNSEINNLINKIRDLETPHVMIVDDAHMYLPKFERLT